MTWRTIGGGALLLAALSIATERTLISAPAPLQLPAAATTTTSAVLERHHYTMSARVRPLLLFWIGRSNVGDAIVTRAAAPHEARYSLLIGSDPERAPRRINRWGYIEERIRGDAATVVGLMTASEEESVEEAEINLRRERSGVHTFKVIHADINAERSRSVVTAVGVPAEYSFRQLEAVLALAGDGSDADRSRVVQLPRGTRAGFLSALGEIIHAQAGSAREGGVRVGGPLTYVYHGKLYELRSTSAELKPTFEVNASRYARAVSSQFATRSLVDGEETRFALSFGIDGRLAEVPLTASYQPRWWMQVNLALADDVEAPQTGSIAAPTSGIEAR